MSIKETEVEVSIANRNKSLYKDRLVAIKDLSKDSRVVLTKICDVCGAESKQLYKNILEQRKNSEGRDLCFYCGNHSDKNIIIEYDGDYWHSKTKVRDSNCREHYEEILQTIRNFYENN